MTNQDASKHLGGREGKQQSVKTNTKQGISFSTWTRCATGGRRKDLFTASKALMLVPIEEPGLGLSKLLVVLTSPPIRAVAAYPYLRKGYPPCATYALPLLAGIRCKDGKVYTAGPLE